MCAVGSVVSFSVCVEHFSASEKFAVNRGIVPLKDSAFVRAVEMHLPSSSSTSAICHKIAEE